MGYIPWINHSVLSPNHLNRSFGIWQQKFLGQFFVAVIARLAHVTFVLPEYRLFLGIRSSSLVLTPLLNVLVPPPIAIHRIVIVAPATFAHFVRSTIRCLVMMVMKIKIYVYR